MPIKKMFLTFLATLVGEGIMTIDDFFWVRCFIATFLLEDIWSRRSRSAFRRGEGCLIPRCLVGLDRLPKVRA